MAVPFDGESFSLLSGIGWLHVGGMKRTDTWKPLGALASQIAARLTRCEAEIEKPSAGSPKATSGGSALTGNRMDRRSEYAATMAGEDRSSHPVGENVIDYRDRATLLAAWGSGYKPRHSRSSFNSAAYTAMTSAARRSKAKAKSASLTPIRQATTDQ